MEIDDIPEYEVTSDIIKKIFEIERLLVSAKGLGDRQRMVKLRKDRASVRSTPPSPSKATISDRS